MATPKCAVSFGGSDSFPAGATWYLTWLPKGYGPTESDRIVCAIPDQGWSEYSVKREEGAPPLVEAIAKAIEAHHEAPGEIEKLRRRLAAAVRVLDAITDADGNLSLPEDGSELRAAFDAAKDVP